MTLFRQYLGEGHSIIRFKCLFPFLLNCIFKNIVDVNGFDKVGLSI